MKRLDGRDRHESIRSAAQGLDDKLAAIESNLIIPGKHTDTFGLNLRTRLNAALATVVNIVDSADGPPTAQANELADEYISRIDAEFEDFKAAVSEDLTTVNAKIRAAELPGVLGSE